MRSNSSTLLTADIGAIVVEHQTGIIRTEAKRIADIYRSLGGHRINLDESNFFSCELLITKPANTGDIQGEYRRVG